MSLPMHRRDMLKLSAALATGVAAWEGNPETLPLLERLRANPALLMELADKPPDPWQRKILNSSAKRLLLLASRQSGKSQVAAALALRAAFFQAPALVLLLSPSQRQSGELYRDKVLPLYNRLGRPVPLANPRDNALRLELSNGSRIVSLPGKENTLVGYSGVALLVIDEAARVPDSLYKAVRPMLAVSGGTLLALSTPFGKRGWFYEEWHSERPWTRVQVTAEQCPRISPEFLAEEREALGSRWYQQEYMTEFADMVDAVFRSEDIYRARADDVEPLWGG